MITYRVHTVLSVMHLYRFKHIVALGHNTYIQICDPSSSSSAR